ncbi:MAG: hypothetical protein JWN14_5200 [Chthonomonadales bacterium]|nr:hypothetical protein [Chthonomonadales bacterium]
MTSKALAQREDWWRLYLRQHDAALEAQRQYLVTRLNEKPKPSIETGFSPIQSKQRASALAFYYELPHDLKVMVANQMIETLMYSTTAFVSDGTVTEGSVVRRFSDLPPACQEALRSDYASDYLSKQHISEKDVAVRIANEGLLLNLHVLLPSGGEITSGFGFSVGQAPDAAPLSLRHQYLVAIVDKLGKRAPDDWKRLAAFQKTRIWPNDPPEKKMAPRTLSVFGPPRLSEKLSWLKEKSSIEFISDYYDRGGASLSEAAKAAVPAEPVKLELDELAAEQDISWRPGEAGLYLFRNNRWYCEDGLQVPLPLLRELTNELLAHPPQREGSTTKRESTLQELKARMDVEARIVTELTPYQIANGLEWAAVETHPKKGPAITVFPFAGFADQILHERYTALFYGSLNDSARTALIEGRLPFAELSPDQQRQAIFVVPSLVLQSPENPVYLRLNNAVGRTAAIAIPGGTVRGIHLDVVTPPTDSNP